MMHRWLVPICAILMAGLLAAEEAPEWYKGPVVFQSNRTGNFEIYLRDENKVLTNISNNPADDMYPSFSLDGKRLVFTSDRGGEECIWIMNSDGTLQEQLISSPDGPVTYPHYSGDGKRIVFTGPVKKSRSSVFIFDRATREITGPVGPAGVRCEWGQLAVDNVTLAFTQYAKPGGELPEGWHVTLMDMTTGEMTIVGRGCQPSFSKDGTKLLYVHFRENKSRTDIYMYDRVTGKDQRMTNVKEFPYFPRFCPSQNWIVFASSDSKKNQNHYELYLMPSTPFAESLRFTHNEAEDSAPDIR
ncbi:MAG: hypothetical protein AB1714_20075 [Acidobacteriota bacterium]